jgi:S-adenosylmethionine hydrolase
MGKMIALLSDFGMKDIYVGVMKGVMIGICPDARFIDLTHAIQPQNVREAAFALVNAYRFLPQGAVFLVVIDPGVGSMRRPIAVEAGGYRFVGPDNGVLTYALAELGKSQAVELTNSEYRLEEVSHTFHGRDIFAPAAAHLAAGVPLTLLGDVISEGLATLPIPEMQIGGKYVLGEVVHIDHFGNIVTSIGHLRWLGMERLMLRPHLREQGTQPLPVPAEDVTVTIHDQTCVGVRHSYAESRRGDLIALVGSSGYLEIAVNQGNAALRLDAAIGDRVEVEIGQG